MIAVVPSGNGILGGNAKRPGVAMAGPLMRIQIVVR